MKKLGKLQIGLLATAIAVAAVVISTSIFYQGHWFNSTTVNGIDVSNCSYNEAKTKLENAFSDYQIEIKGREQGSLRIAREEIDFKLAIEEDLNRLYDEQHDSYFLFHLFGSKEYNCGVNYSEKKLTSLIKKSELVKGSSSYKIQKPKNAYLEYNKDKGALEIIPEVYGNQLNMDVLSGKLKEAITNLDTSLDLTANSNEETAYKIPTIKQDSKSLVDDMEKYNQVVNHWITWDMGEGQAETITPDRIYKWIHFKKNGKLVVDEKKVGNWVTKFCTKYRTVGKTRTLKTHSGKKVEIEGGDYGWIINYDKTQKQAVKAIKNLQNSDDIHAYIDSPSEEMKSKLTTTLKPQYLLSAYQKDYENFNDDWNHKRYVEVSLTEQKVYVWKNGKCIYTAKCITGKPTPERRTKTGTFYIKEHTAAKTLVGDDYKTPVKFWTRITWSGTGFHSATWQAWSRWTPNYYKSHGSHGCVNLSLTDSKKIYELTKTFDPVFIY